MKRKDLIDEIRKFERNTMTVAEASKKSGVSVDNVNYCVFGKSKPAKKDPVT